MISDRTALCHTCSREAKVRHVRGAGRFELWTTNGATDWRLVFVAKLGPLYFLCLLRTRSTLMDNMSYFSKTISCCIIKRQISVPQRSVWKCIICVKWSATDDEGGRSPHCCFDWKHWMAADLFAKVLVHPHSVKGGNFFFQRYKNKAECTFCSFI